MRIVGGRFRGTQLAGLGKGDPAAHLRPTSDRLRETIFNILAHGNLATPPPPEGARVLDLFAGTGALGFEALSRGAAQVVFVDDGVKARALIRTNADRLGVTGQIKLWRRDATRLGQNRGAAFDLIFLDPPYGKGLGEAALASAHAGGWIAPGALIVWEEGAEITPPPWAEALVQRRHGAAVLTILRAVG
ncbi:MAG: 16S rRNA (guanine(966)-N(2))-methyltransferase RsmD [Alphaproteobacteria bacterium]|nr:MAG: 16S rRNA (guanine(966)-N(2))-methyltransferase RsmD [Alphaproteobacteria bacterium]